MADQPIAFDDERVTRSLIRLLLVKRMNEQLIRAAEGMTTAFEDLARTGSLAHASIQEMDRLLRAWPFKARLPRRTKKALTKLKACRPLTPRERQRAQRAIAGGNTTLDRLQGVTHG